jgi:tetratricopeptide (TPR) repeat protein
MGSARSDRWGVPLQTGNADGVDHFNDAVENLVALKGDPVASAESAVAADQGLVLAQILRAYLCLYGTSASGVRSAAKVLEPLGTLDARLDEREVLHLRAARYWAIGEWHDAVRSLERALLHDSHDLLALKVAQDLYFFLGQSRELQGVVTRVLRAWPAEMEGWGYLQGMFAFGLEENGEYAKAEIHGRAALHRNDGDTWATHALAHVFEMEGRPSEGVTFLYESAPSWSSSYFAVHNWWHRALYHLALGELEDALALYDGPIRGARSAEWLDIVDAAALLWRLSLFGVDVGPRATELADDIEPLIDDPTYIFNDWHAVMTFALAGDHEASERVLTGNRREAVGTNRLVAEQAGLGLLEGFDAFAAGRFDRAVDALPNVRKDAHVVGGSHAQREVIDLTLIAASARAGEPAKARHLATQLVARKPGSAAAAVRLLAANGVSDRRLILDNPYRVSHIWAEP